MPGVAEAEPLTVADAAAWRCWLEQRADTPCPEGAWLHLAKKGGQAATTLSYAQALDEALCFGWIDGQKKSFDEHTFLQRFTPRRPRSVWSKINIGHVERLRQAGKMRPAGEAEVEKAQSDGRWESAYAGAASAEVPADLEAALAASPQARSSFTRYNASNRYAVLWRLQTKKTPAGREKALARLLAMMERGEALHPQAGFVKT